MKKLALALTLAAFAFVPALQAGEAKGTCTDKEKSACAEKTKTACCAEKQAALKKGFDTSKKGAMLLAKR
jgi:hypothetical protein